MVSHLVLFHPRADLTPDERRALVDALKSALRDIPEIRGVRVGVRVKFGAGYEEQMGQQDLTIATILEFDDLPSLQAYLAHPAHQALGARFGSSSDQAVVYDYETAGVDDLDALLRTAGLLG